MNDMRERWWWEGVIAGLIMLFLIGYSIWHEILLDGAMLR